MKWNNSLKDCLPIHKELVIISVNGINYNGVFDADHNLFKTSNRFTPNLFKIGEQEIYWRQRPKPSPFTSK